MEGLTALVIIAILIGYLNLWLIIKKEKPHIIINNKLPDKLFNYEALPEDKNAKIQLGGPGTGSEVPIDTLTTIKDIEGTVNIEHEKLNSSDITDLTTKIKKFRSR